MAENPMYLETVFQQFGSLLRQLSRLKNVYCNDNQFFSPLNVVFSTLGTGHMYLLRVLIGSFDCLHLVIGLVLVYDT